MPKESSGLQNSISSLREFVVFLREAAFISIYLRIIFFPKTFNGVLVRAGFEEGSLVGFKWKDPSI
jgi:hypothetical protein